MLFPKETHRDKRNQVDKRVLFFTDSKSTDISFLFPYNTQGPATRVESHECFLIAGLKLCVGHTFRKRDVISVDSVLRLVNLWSVGAFCINQTCANPAQYMAMI